MSNYRQYSFADVQNLAGVDFIDKFLPPTQDETCYGGYTVRAFRLSQILSDSIHRCRKLISGDLTMKKSEKKLLYYHALSGDISLERIIRSHLDQLEREYEQID